MSTLSGEHVSADQYIRRSPLYRRHQTAGAQFEDRAGALSVATYDSLNNDVLQAGHLGLTDLSTLIRVGFKGAATPDWLEKHDIQLPEAPNRAEPQADGSLVARLSQEEHLILPDVSMNSKLANKLQAGWSLDSTDKVYLLPRHDSHCWLALTGKLTSEALAKVCGVDMRLHKFINGDIAQTSLARVNAIIVRHDLGGTPCFYILSDVSSAEFLWDGLLDAMQEFEGSAVGTAALEKLAKIN